MRVPAQAEVGQDGVVDGAPPEEAPADGGLGRRRLERQSARDGLLGAGRLDGLGEPLAGLAFRQGHAGLPGVRRGSRAPRTGICGLVGAEVGADQASAAALASARARAAAKAS
ncbi:hypothetical protein NS230_07680 [Methylobacterium indicum]|nr:hypothetical protein NS229_11430 [Methylobacterium indicum]KTS53108.1 hypothetical protein NS230_07680 [Methylobacterium indicum]